MKIAIVGVQRRIDEILASRGSADSSIKLVPCCYEHYTQVVPLVKNIRDVDGILFTGKFLTRSYVKNSTADWFSIISNMTKAA